METVLITYERLFNLGNYDHETFKIEKHVQAHTEYEAYKKMALYLAELEEDLGRYRRIKVRILDIQYKLENYAATLTGADKASIALELNNLQAQALAFKEKHQPVTKICNCAFCQAKNEKVPA